MAIISFDTYFNLSSVTKVFNFRDTSNYAGQGISTTNLVGNFRITAPSGTIILNHLGNQTSGTADIDQSTSLNSVGTLPLPLVGSLVEPGLYTIYFEVYDTVTFALYSVTQTYTFSYISPEVCIEQDVDCLSPLFTSTDITNYTVDGVVPTKAETHGIYYPAGSAGYGSPTLGTGLVVTSSTFYNGTQTTTISSVLQYVYPDGLIVSDTVTGSKEVLVDCSDICSIYCCIRTVQQTMLDYQTTNRAKYPEWLEKFNKIMAYASMVTLAIRCGKSTEVNGLVAQILTIGNCTEDCGCSDGTPSQVTGLGGLINNIVVDSCGNGIVVTPVEVGNTITYTVCLSTAFVNLVNSFYNTVVEQGNNIIVTGPVVYGITRTFTVRGQKTLLTAGNNITVTLTYQVSGVLVVGTMYTIAAYVATDDFTNVGAASNATGVTFVATGTTPTTWAAGSSIQITGTSTYNVVGIGPVVVAGNSSVTVTPSTASGFTTYTITAVGIQRKFVKQFTTTEIEQDLAISRAEITACGSWPLPCTPDGTDPVDFVDLHLQTWLLVSTNWKQLSTGLAATDCFVFINNSTGNITVTTGNNSGTYRVVILY